MHLSISGLVATIAIDRQTLMIIALATLGVASLVVAAAAGVLLRRNLRRDAVTGDGDAAGTPGRPLDAPSFEHSTR